MQLPRSNFGSSSFSLINIPSIIALHAASIAYVESRYPVNSSRQNGLSSGSHLCQFASLDVRAQVESVHTTSLAVRAFRGLMFAAKDTNAPRARLAIIEPMAIGPMLLWCDGHITASETFQSVTQSL